MVKNILSSKQSEQIQTTLATVISRKHNKAQVYLTTSYLPLYFILSKISFVKTIILC